MPTAKQEIIIKGAPVPSGAFSHAIRAGDFVFVSGQTSVDITTGRPIDTDIYGQTERAFKNIVSVAESAGGSANSIVKMGIFTTNLTQQTPHINAAIDKWIGQPYPTRTTVSIDSVTAVGNVVADAILYLPQK
ncbi:unnamed protein product, partial [Medioppia subpectinata]